MIDLGSEQLIEHVHGGGEQHSLIAWQARQPMIFARNVLPTPGLPMIDRAGAFLEKVEVEQPQDTVFCISMATLVMFEMEAVDGGWA